jgi:hypothetical protein
MTLRSLSGRCRLWSGSRCRTRATHTIGGRPSLAMRMLERLSAASGAAGCRSAKTSSARSCGRCSKFVIYYPLRGVPLVRSVDYFEGVEIVRRVGLSWCFVPSPSMNCCGRLFEIVPRERILCNLFTLSLLGRSEYWKFNTFANTRSPVTAARQDIPPVPALFATPCRHSLHCGHRSGRRRRYMRYRRAIFDRS